jgi:hypothetical protein
MQCMMQHMRINDQSFLSIKAFLNPPQEVLTLNALILVSFDRGVMINTSRGGLRKALMLR